MGWGARREGRGAARHTMAAAAAAPTAAWLCGAWERRYIQQGEPLPEAERDGSVTVRYIQTPAAFVDVRVGADRPPWPEGARSTLGGTVAALEAQGFGKPGWSGMMAFAGVAVVRDPPWQARSTCGVCGERMVPNEAVPDKSFPPLRMYGECDICSQRGTTHRCGAGCDYDLCARCHGTRPEDGGLQVHWEEALNLWPPRPAGWATIDAGLPLGDGGAQALLLEGTPPDITTWHEREPPGSEGTPYLEEWVRLPGDGPFFFAARCGDALLVVAGDWFGYAEDSRDRAAVLAGLGEGETYDSPGAVGRLASSLLAPLGAGAGAGAGAAAGRVAFVAGRRSTGWAVEVSAAGGGESQRLAVASDPGWRLAGATDSSPSPLEKLLMGAEFIAADAPQTGLPVERGDGATARM